MLMKKYKWGERDIDVEEYLNRKFKKILWLACLYTRVDGLYYYVTIFHVSFLTIGEWYLVSTMIISIFYCTDNMVSAMRFLRMGSLIIAINFCMLYILPERSSVTEMIKLHIDNYYDYKEDTNVEDLKTIKKERRNRMKHLLMIPAYGLYTGISMFVIPLFYYQSGELPKDIFDTEAIFPTWSLAPNNPWVRLVSLVLLISFILHLLFEAGGGCLLLVHLFESLIGQIQVLNQSLSRFEERVETHFTKMREINNSWRIEDSRNHCLKQNIEHYLLLQEFREALEKVVAFTLFALLMNAISILAANAFLLVIQDDNVMLTLAISGLITECYFIFMYNTYGQLIINESEKVQYAVYNLNWFNFTIKQMKTINIMQIMTHRPMRLSLAGGLMGLELVNFLQIVKTTYSLINFLIAVN